MNQINNNNANDFLIMNGNKEDDNNIAMTKREQQKGMLVHGSIYDDDTEEKFVNQTTIETKASAK
jgi:hypothetical protein